MNRKPLLAAIPGIVTCSVASPAETASTTHLRQPEYVRCLGHAPSWFQIVSTIAHQRLKRFAVRALEGYRRAIADAQLDTRW